jgi:hypothetical protein
VPLTDAGEVNQEALNTAAEAAIRAERVYLASGLEAGGAGRVAGLGADGDPHTQMTAEQFEGGMSKIFESIGMPDEDRDARGEGAVTGHGQEPVARDRRADLRRLLRPGHPGVR